MNTDQEVWARINGFENEPYEISTFGKVRRLPHITISSVGARIAYGGANVRTSIHRPSGGLTFNVYAPDPDTGKKKAIHLWVHRAVAMTFIPNPGKRYTVNHKDGNRTNNHIENLEWATYSENHLHAYNILVLYQLQFTNAHPDKAGLSRGLRHLTHSNRHYPATKPAKPGQLTHVV